MNKAEQRLASSLRAWRARQDTRAFSNKSEDVRAWEPEPTLELARAFVPKRTESMYTTARGIMDGTLDNSGEPIDKFRGYS